MPPLRSRSSSTAHEGFLDTLTINGEVGHEFITHYYPNVLVAMRERWIAPQMVATNRIDAPGYDEVKAMARKVIRILGIDTSATHMEWFFGSKGLKFSEIGCRPPGVGQWDVYSAANEFDLYYEWAHALVHGRIHTQPSRRFACGMIALRPERDGHISGYSGVAEVDRKYGECIVAAHLPAPGTPTQTDRGRIHGQCLDAGASPRLRQAKGNPGRDRAGRQGSRSIVRCASLTRVSNVFHMAL